MSTSSTAQPVAIMVAMRSELRHLFDGFVLDEAAPGSIDPALSALTDDDRQSLAELPAPTLPPVAGIWPVWSGMVGATSVRAVLTGIGPANAAGALGALLATEQLRAVISYGCAGAHHRELGLGDVVIGTRSINHAAFNLQPDGTEHYRGNAASTGPDPMPPSEIESDPTLLAAAQRAAADWSPAPWPSDGRVPGVHVGAVASADAWTQEEKRLDLLHERHASLCEEMETAALGVICQRRGIPLLPIKDISNNEYHAVSDVSGGLEEFPLEEVGRRAAALVIRTLHELGRSGND